MDSREPSFKHKAEMLDKLIADSKIRREETAYVGDRIEDYNAANSNNLDFIHASWGYGTIAKSLNLNRMKSPGDLYSLLC
jgi:phosphoglycolate phosphatase